MSRLYSVYVDTICVCFLKTCSKKYYFTIFLLDAKLSYRILRIYKYFITYSFLEQFCFLVFQAIGLGLGSRLCQGSSRYQSSYMRSWSWLATHELESQINHMYVQLPLHCQQNRCIFFLNFQEAGLAIFYHFWRLLCKRSLVSSQLLCALAFPILGYHFNFLSLTMLSLILFFWHPLKFLLGHPLRQAGLCSICYLQLQK